MGNLIQELTRCFMLIEVQFNMQQEELQTLQAGCVKQTEDMNSIVTNLHNMSTEIRALKATIAEECHEITELNNQLVQERIVGTESSVGVKEPKIADPEYFTGNRKRSKEFLLQLNNIFAAQPQQYPNDCTKLAYAVSFLCGAAFTWIAPYLEANHSMLSSVKEFQELFCLAFGDVDRVQEVEQDILKIRQGNHPASVLVSEFQRLAIESAWPEKVLFSLFYQSLNDSLKDKICKADRPTTMEEYYKLAVRLDNRLFEQGQERRKTTYLSKVQVTEQPSLVPTPMVINTTQLQTTRGPKSQIEDTSSNSGSEDHRSTSS